MVTNGKAKVVVDIQNSQIHIGEWLAWMIWMFLHLMLIIIGVKNKLQILFIGFINIITNDQNLCLATKKDKCKTSLV